MKTIVIKTPTGVSVTFKKEGFSEFDIILVIANRILKFIDRSLGEEIIFHLKKYFSPEVFYQQEATDIQLPYKKQREELGKQHQELLENLRKNKKAEKQNQEELKKIKTIEQKIEEISLKENKEVNSFLSKKSQLNLKTAKSLIPESLEYTCYDEIIKIPAKGTIYREAWIYDEDKVSICPHKLMNVIRRERNLRLEQLDEAQSKGQYNPNFNNNAVEQKKQELRELPAKLEGKEPEDIINIVEAIL